MGKKLAVAGGVVGVALVGGLAYLLYKANEEVKVSNFIGEDGHPDFSDPDKAMKWFEEGGIHVIPGSGCGKKSGSGLFKFLKPGDPLDEMLGYRGNVSMQPKMSSEE